MDGLQDELLRMIEWDHQLRYGSELQIGHLGTRMRQWMDPEIQVRLEAGSVAFGSCNSEALQQSFALFGELADRVAENAELVPFHLGRVSAEIHRILQAGS